MISLFLSFFSLYLATLLMSLGTGLYNTFIALHLTHQGVSEVWIGLLIAAFYTGQVLGARFGHKLVLRVGHIRAYAISAAMVTVLVLAQTITPLLPVWVFLRFLTGATMVTQYMVLESWLNDQADQKQRGSVFAFYMVMSGLGLVGGQMTVSLFTPADLTTLNVVAMSMALCLIPVAITRRSHPPLQVHAPIKLKVFIRLVPMSMFVLFVAGSITGSFYGLGPVYASKEGMNTDQVAVFLSVSVLAGLLSQWPMGWLSDRIYRLNMIRFNALLLGLLTIPLYGYWHLPYSLMLVLVAVFGVLQFTIYPLATAFANEHVDPSLRVGLSGVLLMTYGVGASLGPLLVGKLMDIGGAHMFYIYTSLAAFSLVIFVRKEKVKGTYKVDPEPFVPMSVNVPASPMATALDPRVDESIDISSDPQAMDKVLDIIQAGDPITELNLPHRSDADHSVADEDLAMAGEEMPGDEASINESEGNGSAGENAADENSARGSAIDEGASESAAGENAADESTIGENAAGGAANEGITNEKASDASPAAMRPPESSMADRPKARPVPADGEGQRGKSGSGASDADDNTLHADTQDASDDKPDVDVPDAGDGKSRRDR